MKTKRILFTLLIAGMAVLLAACGGTAEAVSTDQLSASGVISAQDLRISPEIGGKVAEVT